MVSIDKRSNFTFYAQKINGVETIITENLEIEIPDDWIKIEGSVAHKIFEELMKDFEEIEL